MKEKFCVLIQISLMIVPHGPTDNKSVLFQVMAWYQTGDKPILGPMMTQFSDAYMRHLASINTTCTTHIQPIYLPLVFAKWLWKNLPVNNKRSLKEGNLFEKFDSFAYYLPLITKKIKAISWFLTICISYQWQLKCFPNNNSIVYELAFGVIRRLILSC